MTMLHEGMALIAPYLAHYGAFALLVIIYLETLGVPLPGESALLAAGALAAAGEFPILQVTAASWAGAVLGDFTAYGIGRWGGRSLLERLGPRFRVTPDRLARIEGLFARRGILFVVAARFVIVLRQLNGLLAGSLAMKLPRFAVADVLGAGLWTLAFTMAGYFFTELFEGVHRFGG